MATPPRLDVYSLRLFAAVAEQGSIARAAAQEHIAASALSRRVADLEHALGVHLLVRSARGIELTEAGRFVFERARRIDQDLQGLAQQARGLGGQVVGQVRLCANASSVVGFLPERLQRFVADHPAVEVLLQEERSRDVLRACLDDRADVGIAVAMDTPAGLDAWHFAQDPLQVVMPAGHALAGQEHVGFGDVLAAGLVGIQGGGALDQTLREHALSHGGAPMRPRVTVNSFDGACRMVEAGLGVAVVPASAATAYAGSARFALRPLAEPWGPRELRVYALHKVPRRAAVERLIEALRRPPA